MWFKWNSTEEKGTAVKMKKLAFQRPRVQTWRGVGWAWVACRVSARGPAQADHCMRAGTCLCHH